LSDGRNAVDATYSNAVIPAALDRDADFADAAMTAAFAATGESRA